jgi:hypothetical protein
MPDPHPSIVWGTPENDADGLKYWVEDHEPSYFKRYIFSGWIEGKLEAACRPMLERTDISKNGPREDHYNYMSGRRGRAVSPHGKEYGSPGLSRRYERKMKRTKQMIGLARAEQKHQRALDGYVDLYNKILRMPLKSRNDLEIKLAIYRDYNHDIGAEEILRDIELLMKRREGLSGIAA